MTATATEKMANTVIKYGQQHGFLLKTKKQQVLKFRLGTYVTPLRGPQGDGWEEGEGGVLDNNNYYFLGATASRPQFWCNGRGKKGRPLPWVINYVTENWQRWSILIRPSKAGCLLYVPSLNFKYSCFEFSRVGHVPVGVLPIFMSFVTIHLRHCF